MYYYKIGYQEGFNETKLRTAKNLLDELSIEEIAKATSLSIEEVKELSR